MFCPKCSAPQIRVSTEEVFPVAGPAEPLIYQPAAPTNRIEWSSAWAAIGWAVALACVVTLITVGSLGLGMLVAGALSVVFYRRRHPLLNLTASMGARLGAVAGALGFAVGLVGLAVAILGFHAGPKVHDTLVTAVERSVASHPMPGSQEFLESFKTSQGFATWGTVGLVFSLMLCVGFACVGGALGALLFRRRKRM